ncbi:hypothetical protein BDD12DRAFT_919576 [Trichophaea hybrida]|nr:hypothetical protein BDD12DRAFT_919576 [Trichophaea hybrida]
MPKEQKSKSPLGGLNAVLPASVEESYRQKCKEIKKRILEIENSNDLFTSRIERARRAIQRMRLERAFLLEQLEKRTDARVADSEGSPSPPPTPSQKPLRVKRQRKEIPRADSPLRHASDSPNPRDSTTEYPFVNQSFISNQRIPSMYTLSSGSTKVSKGNAARPYNGYRSRGGPKRPPNAYMIFCERERDAVRERESFKDGFDMHKALAQAWRDLKQDGQKPYFDEYEKNKASYTQKVNELRDFTGSGKRAPSTGSSIAPAGSFERGVSPIGTGSTNDDETDDNLKSGTMTDYRFDSINQL